MRGFSFGTTQSTLTTTTRETCSVGYTEANQAGCFALPSVLLELLSADVIDEVQPHADKLEEIRLRAGRYVSLTVRGENISIEKIYKRHQLEELLVRMCKGSLYSYAEDIRHGFVTLEGGVRVGVIGKASTESGHVTGVSEISSLSIRIPHKMQVNCDALCSMIADGRRDGMLIYSPPGEGKTTLLRAIARRLGGIRYGLRVAVVDTRAELEYDLSDRELLIDVLSGYPIDEGIEIAARTMNAQVIICDEIGSLREAAGVISAHGCGVPLVASAHGSSKEQLLCRPGIRALDRAGVFGKYVQIKRDGRGGFEYDVSEGGVTDGL